MSKSLKLFGAVSASLFVGLLVSVNFANRNVAGLPEAPRTLTALPAPIPEPAKAVATDAPAGGLIAAAQANAPAGGTRFGLGRAALSEEIAAWDVDVRPDGTGLPVGSGNALDGEMLFEESCAMCHGSFGEGVDNWPMLAGGEGTLADEDPVKTVGSYWPYVSTVWDYVHRSMPFGNAQSLSDDDVYAITAYILYSNDLIADDFELSNESWAEVTLPNAGGFVIDDRAETEYPLWRTEPCMQNCKNSVEITMRATVLDVTPDDGSEAPAMKDHTDASDAPAATDQADVVVASADDGAAPAADAPVIAAALAVDPELVSAGKRVFGKCKACHQVGDGAKNRIGPHLNGILGRAIGGLDGYKYSKTMANVGGVWDAETLAAFLANPRGVVKGTKMAFAGLKKDKDINAVLAYLQAEAGAQ